MAGDIESSSPSKGGPGAGERGPKQAKSHIYFGKIAETADRSAAAVCEDAPVGHGSLGELPAANAESAESEICSDPSVRQNAERLKAFQTQQVAASFKTVAPTIDADVRDALRRMEEPVTLFGEGPFERRARLKALLAEGRTIPPPVAAPPRQQQPLGAPAARVIAVKKPQVKEEEEEAAEKEQEEIEGTFYTEGQPNLLAFRKFCAAASGPAAQKRLRREAVYRQHAKQLQQEKVLSCLPPSSPILDMHFFNKFIQHRMALAASIVGDERPLTCCRFSPVSPLTLEVTSAATSHEEGRDQEIKGVGNSEQVTPASTQALLATASWGENVKVWRPSDGRLLLQLKQHKTRVHSLAWSRCNSEQTLLLASGSADATVCLWNLGLATKVGACTVTPSSKLLAGRLTGHEDRINRVSFHPTGRCLATTSHDETWRLWDVETQEEILLQEGHSAPVYAVCFHPDGSIAVTSDLTGLVKVTDVRVGRGVLDIAAHVKQVVALSVHPVCSNWMVTGGDDNCVKLWDLRKVASTSAAAHAAAADQGTSAANCMSQPLLTIPAHTKMVTECIFEPQNGRCLYTSALDGLVKIWSCTDFSLQKSLPAHDGKVMGIDVLDSSEGKGTQQSVKKNSRNGCPIKEDPSASGSEVGHGGGDMVASVGFDRTWKLWHCSGVYDQKETEAFLLQQYEHENKPAGQDS